MPALHFRPALWSTLLTLGLVALFVGLGEWQLGKARAKEATQASLEIAGRLPPLALPAERLADPSALEFRRVVVRGRYDAGGQILLDNRVLQGRAGFHVITPLAIDGARDGRRVLVNRGWIPAPASRGAPVDAAVPAGPVVIEGTAVLPPQHYFRLGADDAPPGDNAIWQHLDLPRYQAAARQPLQPLLIQLAAEAPGGFERSWPRRDAQHERHRSYAGQWFAFAATSVAIWFFFACRRGTTGPDTAATPPQLAAGVTERRPALPPHPTDPAAPPRTSRSAVPQPAAPTR